MINYIATLFASLVLTMFRPSIAFVSRGMSAAGKCAYPRFRISSSKNVMNPITRSLPTTTDVFNPFQDLMPSFTQDLMPSFAQSFPVNLHADVKETDKTYEIMVDIPGVQKKDINISVRDSDLIISANRSEVKKEERGNYRRIERSSGHMSRTFFLPENVHEDQIEARSEDGVLHITIPKSEEHVVDAKVIEVK